ncbi:UDP-N-acetylglucosamine--N-acetylmuramyl-(pentapeptide) pyrophosphoryl-undecaprenol N-acetylglucosamine transferase [Halobacteriovorax sp. JY17]|uniref:UDP-N-acetylglucosamine--N-acetylmuramyl- (pentapeptide) pyrophosphoryl-undecaprenol N-acetylglucosamine transferase n=1 Tax=Halobacteriovorax sp. JY17 TaxID=2014617 RepID=UPI000C53DE34|nr:UDP-N-acetylglucosamine--N-acetylmuramyl-(pentapeptide) pyrophosphoryl-undecaprenol N-acetylglucosamine transferase [Halobacteriovorax sp. JY17]PIK14763.1 MAG: UDP-N-acetylglucosamine--N-acetylmuramyl-(pentapeptide) pyrophosphoryl-undecaprenol N-acetylglucosamine transferase [Halobacteriovorax sp. JY17]
MKKIIFTGGGSGGHVMPAITLLKELINDENYSIYYIGGRNSIERNLISEFNIKYVPIFTGKLRRYLSLENFTDIFKIILGTIQSFFFLLFKSRDTLIFSTGGFVSVPVVVAGKLTGKKIFIHEQTSRVGLANKICSIFANKVFVSFEESLKFFPKEKTILSGYPIRRECFDTSLNFSEFKGISLSQPDRPILFITGGGNGSLLLNDLIKEDIKYLEDHYITIHQVGKKFISEFEKLKTDSYIPVSFIGKEIIDIMKSSAIIISRAGAGTVCELMALQKRSIFVPLKIAQQNEQYHNAMEASRKLGSLVISEDELLNLSIKTILSTFNNQQFENKGEFSISATDLLVEEIRRA